VNCHNARKSTGVLGSNWRDWNARKSYTFNMRYNQLTNQPTNSMEQGPFREAIDLQLIVRFPAYYETRIFSTCSQEPVTCSYPESALSSPWPFPPCPFFFLKGSFSYQVSSPLSVAYVVPKVQVWGPVFNL